MYHVLISAVTVIKDNNGETFLNIPSIKGHLEIVEILTANIH